MTVKCPTCKLQWLYGAPPWDKGHQMMVMPANQTGELVHLWAGMYGNVGHLYTPARSERIRPWLPYALDNGRYAEAVNNRAFDAERFWRYLDNHCNRDHRPRWIAVPDVPFDGTMTLEWWMRFESPLRAYGVPLALVVQDGMTTDVLKLLGPDDVVFVGGSTEWKWKTIPQWSAAWPRVHVGRVNTQKIEKLRMLRSLGIQSCDGSGWFRGKGPQVVTLARFLSEQSGNDAEFAERCALSTRYASRDQLTFSHSLMGIDSGDTKEGEALK